ncbi:MAG: CRISPR-associated helicase Cas3' [Lachnospiraceae bacterium]|nr:CRISPR-associated helicase Cas3' [Lachnospiraceae bacterium]
MRKNLCVVCLKNPSDAVRGKLRRYLYELRANVFCGTISSGVREILWKKIKETNTNALIVYSSQSEQGFTYESTTKDTAGFEDFDGLLLPYIRSDGISVSDLYAKPSKKLIDHLMEAGVVAEALMRYGIGAPAIETMSERFTIPKDELISSIAWLCALHDIGKAHPGFQKSLAEAGSDAADACVKLMLAGNILPEDEKIRHERYSTEILRDWLVKSGFPAKGAAIYSDLILFHHQGKRTTRKISEGMPPKTEPGRWEAWVCVQQELIERISERWVFSEKLFSITGQSGINGFTYLILSIMVTTDWIVSGSRWEEIRRETTDLDTAAERFIQNNHLAHISIKDRLQNASWASVFSFDRNQLQEAVYGQKAEHSRLMLIESPCGCGKTEAALIAAIRQYGFKGGIYFAAPTTSTAKGLAKRMHDLAIKAGFDIPIPELDSSMVWSNDDMSRIPKELWTSKTRHQGLYPFAVGTVDQILKSVLSFRYSCIGLLGLSDKVVVIDEIHAYDAYMLKELETLIRWCRFFKVPVVLLSATLPTKTKKILFKAAGYSGTEISDAYPLVSTVEEKELTETEIAMPGRKIPVAVQRVKDIEETMMWEAKAFAEGCLALIAPTVDTAFHLYRRLQRETTDGEVFLYHGRDTIRHKAGKIEKLLKYCGKDRSGRPKKLIVVATSIIEQSLDVDFDKMITALAPDDLLIQRMGRLWRHSDIGTVREHSTISEPFVILCPEKYGNLGRIYEKNILSATEEVLQGLSGIDTIADVRRLIDAVYDNTEIESEFGKQIAAGRHVIESPTKDVVITTKGTDDAYHRFDPLIPKTRDESYPSETICILPELKEEYTYDEMQQIMQKNVISSVSLSRLKDFEAQRVDTGIKWLEDIAVFTAKDLCVDNGEYCMILTEDGLEFVKNTD